MNKRIQLIAEQVADNLDPEDCMVSEEFLEKYTELIVKECAGIVEEHQPRYLTRGQAHDMANTIKEHFGVEE